MAKDPYAGLQPNFMAQIKALVAASGGRITIVSGYRSIERQTQLWNAAVAKYGKEGARKWVAPPGKSNHNHGVAVDLGGDLKLAHKLAPQFGLRFPMAHEPWHVEPAQLKKKGSQAYTQSPGGLEALDTFMTALFGQESQTSGGYSARNSRTGAYGKYQIMPVNWASWAKAAGLPAHASQTPENQERVARHRLTTYYKQFGSWDAVAVAWYAGADDAKLWVKNRNAQRFNVGHGVKGKEPSINAYVRSVIGKMGPNPAATTDEHGHSMAPAKPADPVAAAVSNFASIIDASPDDATVFGLQEAASSLGAHS